MIQPAVSLTLPAFFPPQAFALPGLLPQNTCVLLDLRTCSAIVLRLDAQCPPLVCACQLTPSAARIFLALLQVYPQYCSHQRLFSMLYGSQQEERRPVWEPASGLKAIRRALFSLSSALRSLGFEAVALRGRGYVLATTRPPDEHDARSTTPDPHAGDHAQAASAPCGSGATSSWFPTNSLHAIAPASERNT